jgi:hypothetical protein
VSQKSAEENTGYQSEKVKEDGEACIMRNITIYAPHKYYKI